MTCPLCPTHPGAATTTAFFRELTNHLFNNLFWNFAILVHKFTGLCSRMHLCPHLLLFCSTFEDISHLNLPALRSIYGKSFHMWAYSLGFVVLPRTPMEAWLRQGPVKGFRLCGVVFTGLEDSGKGNLGALLVTEGSLIRSHRPCVQ